MSRRRLYIPITRSGSSILASIFTQLLDRNREIRYPNGQFPYFLMWCGIFLGGAILLIIFGTVVLILRALGVPGTGA